MSFDTFPAFNELCDNAALCSPPAFAVLAVVPVPAVYSPGRIRTHTDAQRAAVDAFVTKYPEYARLAPDVLLQYAETYRDDRDHALEQEFRDNGVLKGCRVDYRPPAEPDWDEVPTSDNSFQEEQS